VLQNDNGREFVGHNQFWFLVTNGWLNYSQSHKVASREPTMFWYFTLVLFGIHQPYSGTGWKFWVLWNGKTWLSILLKFNESIEHYLRYDEMKRRNTAGVPALASSNNLTLLSKYCMKLRSYKYLGLVWGQTLHDSSEKLTSDRYWKYLNTNRRKSE